MTVSLLAVKAYPPLGVGLIHIDSAALSTSPPYPGFTSLDLMIQCLGKTSIAVNICNDDAFLNQGNLMGTIKTDDFSWSERGVINWRAGK
jgi:hypothetical protein